MLSGARFWIQRLAAPAGAAAHSSRVRARAAGANRRIDSILGAGGLARAVDVRVRVDARHLAVLDPGGGGGLLLDVDPAHRAAPGEPHPGDHDVPLLEEVDQLEAHVV